MSTLFARKALLANGWQENVGLSIEDGLIVSIDPDCPPPDDGDQVGIVIPGLCNAHSHAFQRALAGRTEYRGPAAQDTFWTWRALMYQLAARIDAKMLQDIARQLYVEMVSSGYTTVVEFHYLHRQAGESAVTDAMLNALLAAASDAGIRLTYVPILYERGGFGGKPLSAEQEHFAMSLDEFVKHYEQAKSLLGEPNSIAIGAHSLRAVSPESLTQIAALAKSDGVPMHVHIAEQQREVDECMGAYHARPVFWLMDNYEVDSRWCLVHATHMDNEELELVANSGAVVCLCPSTEANLGDGLFRLQLYLQNDGLIAIGSDSHVTINPFEELRWLEYGQRLVARERNVAAVNMRNTGRSLYQRAAIGGASAAGNADGGRLIVGGRANLLVLDDRSPMLTGHDAESVLDALVFSGFTLPIDRVMVNGDWKVRNGRHECADLARQEYADAIGRLHWKYMAES